MQIGVARAINNFLRRSALARGTLAAGSSGGMDGKAGKVGFVCGAGDRSTGYVAEPMKGETQGMRDAPRKWN
jgi:hypothetical protein